jgi:hypothetical protein
MNTNININIEDIYYDKYIKYKTKYLELKEQSGGSHVLRGKIEFNNEKYLLPIEIIYSLLIKILDIFIPEDIQKIPEKPKEKTPEKQKKWFPVLFKTKIEKPKIEEPKIEKPKIEEPKIEKPIIKEEIIQIFKSIKEYLIKSFLIYNNLYNRITKEGIRNNNMFKCCREDVLDIEADIKNKKIDIIDSILKIKKYHNNHKEELNLYGENIIKQINLYLSKQYKHELYNLFYNRDDVYYTHFSNEYDKELELFFPNENYKHEINGFNNLEYIINYYFYKINFGIQHSHVYILKSTNNEDNTIKLPKTCFNNPNINILPPDPPPDILPLITNNGQVTPTRLPNYLHSIDMTRSSQKHNVSPPPPPRLKDISNNQVTPSPNTGLTSSSNKDSVPPRPPRPSKD